MLKSEAALEAAHARADSLQVEEQKRGLADTKKVRYLRCCT